MLPIRPPAKRGAGRKRPAGGNNPGGAGEGYSKKIKQDFTEDMTGHAESNVNVVTETAEEHERLAMLYGEGVIIFTTMKNQPDKLAYFCQICQVQLNSRSNLEMHAFGGKHKQNVVLYESGDLTGTDYYEEEGKPLANWENKAFKKPSRGRGRGRGQQSRGKGGWEYGEGGQDWEYGEGGEIRDLRELAKVKGRGKPRQGRGREKPGRRYNGRELEQDWDYGELSHDSDEEEEEEEEGRDTGSQDDLSVREKLIHIREMLLQSEELKPYLQSHGDSGSNRRRPPSDRNLKGQYSPPVPNSSSSRLHDDDDEPPYVPHPRDDPSYVPRHRDGPPYVPRHHDDPSYVPRHRDGPSYVPRHRDDPPYVPRSRDGPAYVPRPRDDPPFVSRPRDGPPYAPHPDDERPDLRRPFPRPASASSIRSSSGAPYVDSERPMPHLSSQTDDAAKTFALLKTLDGYKLSDDYDADTAAVALKTLVNSLKFFINGSSVADASVQIKLKQILDETGGKLETLRSLLREESTASNAVMMVQPSIPSQEPASKLPYRRDLYSTEPPPKPYYNPFL